MVLPWWYKVGFKFWCIGKKLCKPVLCEEHAMEDGWFHLDCPENKWGVEAHNLLNKDRTKWTCSAHLVLPRNIHHVKQDNCLSYSLWFRISCPMGGDLAWALHIQKVLLLFKYLFSFKGEGKLHKFSNGYQEDASLWSQLCNTSTKK